LKINELSVDFSEKTTIFAVEITPKQHGNSSKASRNTWKTKGKH
jgi:hypothetical protein